MTTIIKKREVQIVCPICKTEKLLNIPETILNQAKPLTTISIQKGLLCTHHFQAFIDKNFKVRGYQKIDFEVRPKISKNKRGTADKKEPSRNNDNELFENLIMEGNYIEYRPKNLTSTLTSENFGKSGASKTKKDLTLKEIYELFWDLIDENNSEFKELIIKDKIRRSSLNKKALNLIEH
ncbi:MAG: hypothetical protein EU532_06430 [Promethearchaeota archaeon]|nr:MAG: hypothetical protein EU532_06430 [Candidatus Lokiarchaeota archaeon]